MLYFIFKLKRFAAYFFAIVFVRTIIVGMISRRGFGFIIGNMTINVNTIIEIIIADTSFLSNSIDIFLLRWGYL